MGERYRDLLQNKIQELGGENLTVYINERGVDPHYLEHLHELLKEQGATFVADREGANFVFDGHCEPSFLPGQIVAFFRAEELTFEGAIGIYNNS